MGNGRLGRRSAIKSSSIRYLVLLVGIGIISALVADDDATNSAAVVDAVIRQTKTYLPEVRGNAIWDLIKLLLAWGLRLVLLPAILLLLVKIPSMFSQGIHVSLFVKGSWRGLLWFSGAKSFGRRVRGDDVKEYRKISSTSRQSVIDALNRHSGVFIVMGPTGAGKSLLACAESKAKFVLAIEREEWYDHRKDASPVKEILKDRTTLLVKHLLGICSKPVCVVLTWNSKDAMPLPSKYRLEKIVDQLLGILSASKKFRKVSFVLTIPAYYQIDSPQFDPECDSYMPELHSIYLLDGHECLSLLDAQLQYKAKKEGVDSSKIRHELVTKARDMGMSLERMIWIESLGAPKQVVRIIGQHQYGSPEVWKSLRNWWKLVYDTNEESDCAADNEWLVCLYVIALKSLADGQSVDVESIAKALFDKRSGRAVEAIKRMCLNHRPRTKDEIAEGTKAREVRQHGGRLDPRKIDAEHVFEDRYVIDTLVGSLGWMDDKPGSPLPIFNFSDKIYDAVQGVFDFKDPAVCDSVAAAYFASTERLPDLSKRMEEQYSLLTRLKKIFGCCGMVDAYERRLKDPTVFQEYASALIGRIGVLPGAIFRDLLSNIGKTLRENLSPADYVKLAFEIMPAYVIGRKLPCRWGIDFEELVAVLRDSKNEESRFRCALIVCVAYANYICEETYFNGQIFDAADIKDHFSLVTSAYETVERMCKHAEWWDGMAKMISALREERGGAHGFTVDILNSSSDFSRAGRMVLCYMMNYSHCACNDVNVGLFDALSHGDATSAGEADRLLISFCRSMIPPWYFIREGSGPSRLNSNVDSLLRGIKDWTSCPVAAVECFKSCCNVYRTIFRNSNADFSDANILWELLGNLREWQKGLSDFWYSQCLSSYAALLSGIPNNEGQIYLKNVWMDFAEIVKVFWRPILSLDREFEEWTMPKNFFELYASLSNVRSIDPSTRAALLSEIVPNRVACLCDNSDRIGSAWCIYDCDPYLVPPYLKMFWCVQIMLGKGCELSSDDSAEMIRAVDNLLQEARACGEYIDEGLVKLLYEANGLPINKMGENQ